MIYIICIVIFVALVTILSVSYNIKLPDPPMRYEYYGSDANERYENDKKKYIKQTKKYRFWEWTQDNGAFLMFIWVITILLGICILGMTAAIITEEVTKDSTGAVLAETQKSIEYKVSTDSARDEFGIRNKDIIDEVQNWNVEIIKRQHFERNVWIGIFYADLIDKYDLHIIELE